MQCILTAQRIMNNSVINIRTSSVLVRLFAPERPSSIDAENMRDDLVHLIKPEARTTAIFVLFGHPIDSVYRLQRTDMTMTFLPLAS